MVVRKRKKINLPSDLTKLKRAKIETVCNKHGTTVNEMPAWLLERPIKRIEFYFKELEAAKQRVKKR